MSLITRYILREIAAPTLLGSLVIIFIAVSGRIGTTLGELPIEYVTPRDILMLGFYSFPALASYVIPVSFMMGALLAYGRLAESNEIIAMRAAGIPLARLLLPVLVGGVILSVASFAMLEGAQPHLMARAHKLMYRDLPLRLTIDALAPGVMHQFADWRVYIGDKDAKTRTLYKLDILIPDAKGPGTVFYAESAQVKNEGGQATIELKNGHIIYPVDASSVILAPFPEQSLPVPDLEPAKSRGDRKLLSMSQLYTQQRLLALIYELSRAGLWNLALIESLKAHNGAVRDVPAIPQKLKDEFPLTFPLDPAWLEQVNVTSPSRMRDSIMENRKEIAERLSLPLACVAVTLTAAAAAIRTRHNARSYSFAAGGLIILSYFLATMFVEYGNAFRDLTQVILISQTPNLLFGVTSGFLLWRANRI